MTTSASVPPSEHDTVEPETTVNGRSVAATPADDKPVAVTAAADGPVNIDGTNYLAVAESPDFATLRRTLRRFIFPLSAAFLIWYALYVLLSAFARDFMSTKVVGNINIALVFGLLQFVTTFLIAWLYARYADRQFDPLASKLKARVENGEDR